MVLDARNLPTKIEAQVQRHLLVTGAARMQPLSQITHTLDELTLDECMDVLIVAADKRGVFTSLFEDVVQSRGYFHGIRPVEHAGTGESFDPREAAGNVVFEQTFVEPE